ncbi:Carbohydrate kinase, YjeF related protein [Elusimicrobium minutum Pei191]|uniref:NAD(P)H-hydrate epimerase n=1 Tax=Elusimicrobium minutum (strain Pei191) TaxID=445932 RepID=NNRE_ELUMP|nr:NAD(P)H-hydrate epimerase [Elusimicrobium minutum]B2KES3.1 RecName: Full=NAD(P)H-hydrate epimerase; AltName: Full=NAD(P)HX epimerase [Elusimicrobium minutum Pei191]ACC99019.1 Carbohydrate kinase, YjeF related protein [Elusimicrobium minutum Pei191]
MKTVTSQKMRELETAAVKEFGIDEDVLMEHAGRSAAEEILNCFLSENKEKKVIIVCGHGGNGGDGLVCGRYLMERGVDVYCYIIPPFQGSYKGLVLKNLKRAFFSHLSVKEIYQNLSDLKNSVADAYIVIDALLGIGFKGEVKKNYKETIEVLNSSPSIKIAFDIPSGLNADSGQNEGAVFKADYTYAMGFAKQGCLKAKDICGEIKVLNIGLPKELLSKV